MQKRPTQGAGERELKKVLSNFYSASEEQIKEGREEMGDPEKRNLTCDRIATAVLVADVLIVLLIAFFLWYGCFGAAGSAPYSWHATAATEPSDWGLINYYNRGWYCAHSHTAYGRAIAGLEPGDQVTVNGKTVTVEGRTRAKIGTSINPLWEEIGWEKTLFSTCADDGSDEVWVVYGE